MRRKSWRLSALVIGSAMAIAVAVVGLRLRSAQGESAPPPPFDKPSTTYDQLSAQGKASADAINAFGKSHRGDVEAAWLVNSGQMVQQAAAAEAAYAAALSGLDSLGVR